MPSEKRFSVTCSNPECRATINLREVPLFTTEGHDSFCIKEKDPITCPKCGAESYVTTTGILEVVDAE